MNKLRVLFKCKGGHKEGMGDIVTSLSLAEEFRIQSDEAYFIVNKNPKAAEILSQRNFGVEMAETLSEIESHLSGKKIDIAILNQLDTPVEEMLIFKKQANKVVTLDDAGNSAVLADLRFNVLYPVADSYSELKFAVLSKTFQEKHKLKRKIKDRVERIIVTQGGSDTYGFTPKILKALDSLPKEVAIDVVLGAQFAHEPQLNEAIGTASRDFNLIRGKNDLSDLMLAADLAISAGGITLFELACLGVPAISVCGELFEVPTAERMQQKGSCINLGFGRDVLDEAIFGSVNKLSLDKEMRVRMSQQGRELIDGFGVSRMALKIREFYAKNQK